MNSKEEDGPPPFILVSGIDGSLVIHPLRMSRNNIALIWSKTPRLPKSESNVLVSEQTPHAIDRRKERGISREIIRSIEDIKKLPIYGTDNGCTKFLDMEAWEIKVNISAMVEGKMYKLLLKDIFGIVYYVRGNRIVTMLNGNPIQMLRYYVFGIQTGKIKVECGKLCKSRCKCLDFNNYCRNHSFKNCDRGRRCKYIHVN